MPVFLSMAAESRKRAMEALERRIQTEHKLKEKKNKRDINHDHILKEKKIIKSINEDVKSPIPPPSTSNDPSLPSCRPSSDTPNKGNSILCCFIKIYY